MKKFFTIIMTLLASLMVNTSCNDDYKPINSAIVTVVDGSWDVSYSVRFGDGKTAYVKNTGDFKFSFPTELEGEQRAIIYYQIEEEAQVGYDYVITIVDAGTVPTSNVKKHSEVFEALESYVDKIDIEEASFGDSKYITMLISFMANNPSLNKHKLSLIYNDSPTKEGPFQGSYGKDDSYLWLELHHDKATDTEVGVYSNYQCFKVSTKDLGVKNIGEYKGIKILHKSSSKIDEIGIYTIEFKK